MNAIELLKKQHREVEKLFEKIGSAKDDRKEQLFAELADALAVHATIEERVFYPRIKAEDTEDTVEESLQEHLQVKRLLADMLDMDVNETEFDAKCKVLQEQVDHHVEEEESDLFPAVEKICDAEALDEMAEEMTEIEEELRAEGEPRRHVPDEIGSAPSI